MNLPNSLTVSRIFLVPLLVVVLLTKFEGRQIFGVPNEIVGAAIFAIASLTDWLDGWIARRYDMGSAFGEFLDPVADKLMITAALIVLVELDRANAIIAFVIIGREIAISALREWMATVGQAKSVAVAFIGKLKTLVQMVALPLLLYNDWLFGVVDCQWLGTILINVAAVLTVASMLYYLRKALPYTLNSR